MNTLRQVLEAAPPTPACFPDREQWAAYLLQAQQHAKGTGPFRYGKYRPEFSFCSDCTLAHATAMDRQGKCNPSQFRVPQVIKEVKKHERID